MCWVGGEGNGAFGGACAFYFGHEGGGGGGSGAGGVAFEAIDEGDERRGDVGGEEGSDVGWGRAWRRFGELDIFGALGVDLLEDRRVFGRWSSRHGGYGLSQFYLSSLMSDVPRFRLNNGQDIPAVGIGSDTLKIPGSYI